MSDLRHVTGNLKFGDIYTKDLDLVIQTEPIYTFPAKDVSVEHIPGRNGDLVIDNKCWQNVERVYSLASVFRPGTNFIQNAEKFIKFLTSYKGYQRLEDTYDPEIYRMAQFKSNGSLSNYYDQATILNVTFDCKPQRYLKIGDVPVLFSGFSASLENPTGKPALPIITINNIEHANNIVFLVTIKNNNEVTSSLTLSDVPSGDVIINSELQTVSSIQNGDINRYVSLNDKEFPVLNSGITEVIAKKYIEHSYLIEKYNNIISNDKSSCLALYKPYDAIVESKQKSFYIKSYNLLKQQVQEVYEATAYAVYCLEQAEKYTFISFNTVLDETSQSFTFQTDYSSAPSWLTITGPTNGEITVKVGSLADFTGFSTSYAYFISNSDKVIRKLAPGDTIGVYKESTTVTISVYPADSITNALAVDYSDYRQPNWLKFEITYDNDGSPTKITYKSNAIGYYYLPKSGLFGKAGWAYLIIDQELTSLSWNSSKKKFMPSGISTSTTASFEYSYLDSVPQYNPTYRDVLDENGNVKKDANGNPIQEIDNAVHFNVVALDAKLTSIKYTTKEAGYYRCNDADQGSGWRYLAANVDIPSSCGFVNTITSSNLVYYMSELPKYDSIDGFPEWLDPEPILAGTDVQNGNPTTIDFKVLESNWFRYTFTSSDNTLYTEWVYKQANDNLGIISPATALRGPDDSFTAYMIEDREYSQGETPEFPIKQYTYTDSDNHTINDIGFFYIDSQGQQQEYTDNMPPSWLKVIVVPGVNEDGSDTTLDFRAGSAGSFNWDANTVWIDKLVNGEIVTSTGKDDTSIYYLSSTPSYPTTYTLFSIVINKNVATGNPESVSFIVKDGKAGYYRAKNDTNWKYYNAGDEICNSKISEATTIYNLEDSNDPLDELTISIIPRWWNL